MEFQTLIQAVARPWFIEPAQASVYAEMFYNSVYNNIRVDSIINNDERKYPWGEMKSQFPRVDGNANLKTDGPVQIIKISGALMKNNYCGSPGMESMQQAVRAANFDNTVLCIILVIDSPGGTVDGTDNFSREVRSCTKPVITFVNGMMCSAAYWIGSSADMIICDDANNGYNATIGSIGTMCMWQDTTKQDEQNGVKTKMIRATKSSKKGMKYEELMKGDDTRLIKELDNLNETFLSAVKINREGKLDMSNEDVLAGETYDAKEALKVGLIDRIGSLPLAIKTGLSLAKTIN